MPAASEVGLEICRALRGCKEVVLHGANQAGPSVADFHFLRMHTLPRIDDPQCLPCLQALIETCSIDAIFPAYDDVVLWLAEHAHDVKAAVMAPDVSACRICRSKIATYAALADIVPVPQVWKPDAVKITFPVFVKPDRGQGSQRARSIDGRAALDRALATEPDLLVMENLSGQEYTVDCFSQRGRGVLFASARVRLQTKNGIATVTQVVELPYVREWAEKISKLLNLHGTWFFQIKEDGMGQPKLLEVAPRIAGSMALGRALGPNFPLLSLYEAAGHDLDIDAFKLDGVMMGRSLDVRFQNQQPIDALYVDLDDTLILRDEVNPQLVALIFQCRNRKIPVHLLTRHKADLAATLTKFRLTQLFDHIHHLADDAIPKTDFIRGKYAVLIDDSFRERTTATKRLGIRCYDAASALCLLDERA